MVRRALRVAKTDTEVMNRRVAILDSIPERLGEIKKCLERDGSLTVSPVIWPDEEREVNGNEMIENALSEAHVICIHGSERHWYELIVEARPPEYPAAGEPCILFYRGQLEGPYSLERLKTHEELKPEGCWEALNEKYKVIPIPYAITNGCEIDWVAAVKEKVIKLLVVKYLPALSIMCQGFLATHRQAGVDGGADYKRALDMMGWDQLKDTAIVQNLNGKVGVVQSGSWWQDAIKEDEPEVRKNLAMEMRKDTLPKESRLAQLVEQIYKPSASVDDVNLVAGAFLEIAYKLQ